jgi:hypothetical protein
VALLTAAAQFVILRAMRVFCLVMLLVAGCGKKTTVGGGAMLNMMPVAPPEFVGHYDFDLLEPVQGTACVQRSENPVRAYWIAELPFAKALPRDGLTTGAITAASIDAVGKNPQADTIVITRVVTQGKSPDEVCAFVFGRGVRLKKAAPGLAPTVVAPKPPPPTP